MDDKKVWERGQKLPERETPFRTTGRQHAPAPPSSEDASACPKINPKQVVLAPPPKSNAWGAVPTLKEKPKMAALLESEQSAKKEAESGRTGSKTLPSHKKPASATTATKPKPSAWGVVPKVTPVSPLQVPSSSPPKSASARPPKQHQAPPTVAILRPAWRGPTSVSSPDESNKPKKSKKRKPKFGDGVELGDLLPHHQKKGLQQAAAKDDPLGRDFPALSAAAPPNDASRTPQNIATNQKKRPSPQQANKFPKASKKNDSKPKKKKKSNKAALPTPLLSHKSDDTAIRVPMDAHHTSGGLFAADQRSGMELMQFMSADGEVKKGRQRIAPRKKKFSSLKKKVLEERLRRWKELNPDKEERSKVDAAQQTAYPCVCVFGFCSADEVEDDDEYEECVENLKEMAAKVGTPTRVFIPKDSTKVERFGGNWPVFVDFGSQKDQAAAAIECWNGLVLGGQELKCFAVSSEASSEKESDQEWQDRCLLCSVESKGSSGAQQKPNSERSNDTKTDVLIENALTEDDLEDEECLEESLNDIRTLASKYGDVATMVAETDVDPPRVRISFVGHKDIVRQAAMELNKVVIGGNQVSAKIEDASSPDALIVFLANVLTDDDLEDDDCLNESLDDIRELAQKYGTVSELRLDTENTDNKPLVRLQYCTAEEASKAQKAFDTMVIGGQTIVASRVSSFVEPQSTVDPQLVEESPKEPELMLSGDKIIPERFAECKRVPKIVNTQQPRNYVTMVQDPDAKPLLVEMLQELMRLQKRAVEEKKTKTKRRLVMGLREVARGIRSGKVQMVVMANNIDEYAAMDEKLREIIDLCGTKDVPLFFEFTKRSLGKAIGKSIKIAVVGIQSAEGAHQSFKKLVKIASKEGR